MSSIPNISGPPLPLSSQIVPTSFHHREKLAQTLTLYFATRRFLSDVTLVMDDQKLPISSIYLYDNSPILANILKLDTTHPKVISLKETWDKALSYGFQPLLDPILSIWARHEVDFEKMDYSIEEYLGIAYVLQAYLCECSPSLKDLYKSLDFKIKLAKWLKAKDIGTLEMKHKESDLDLENFIHLHQSWLLFFLHKVGLEDTLTDGYIRDIIYQKLVSKHDLPIQLYQPTFFYEPYLIGPCEPRMDTYKRRELQHPVQNEEKNDGWIQHSYFPIDVLVVIQSRCMFTDWDIMFRNWSKDYLVNWIQHEHEVKCQEIKKKCPPWVHDPQGNLFIPVRDESSEHTSNRVSLDCRCHKKRKLDHTDCPALPRMWEPSYSPTH